MLTVSLGRLQDVLCLGVGYRMLTVSLGRLKDVDCVFG